jgi:hypothetical protein
MTSSFADKFNYFKFIDYSYSKDKNEILFSYSLGENVILTECLEIESSDIIDCPDEKILNQALRLSHLSSGISYYKTIGFKPLEAKIDINEAAFFEKLYRQGLGEFAYINKLSDFNSVKFLNPSTSCNPAIAIPESWNKTILPIGGGKDSLLSLEILKDKIQDLYLFALVRPGQSEFYRRISEKSGIPLIMIKRKLDPALNELNQAGAYNGHVPFSAILAFIIMAVAPLLGIRRAILSNEHSASFPNIAWANQQINHQYSKSLEFENDFIRFNNSAGLQGFEYFSLLRPYTEIAIVREFSKFSHYDSLFTSCNRYFATSQKLWCGTCAKCSFFFILASAFYSEERLVKILGQNLYNQTEIFNLMDELCGFSGHKPFDCVGVPEEACLALLLASKNECWKQSAYIEARAEKILEISKNEQSLIQLAFSKSAEHNIPDKFLSLLNGYFYCR